MMSDDREKFQQQDDSQYQLRFECSICGRATQIHRSELHRELAFCAGCGSNARFRGIALAVSRLIFQDDAVPLKNQPSRHEVRAIGLSDSEVYAQILRDKLCYRNTYFHADPKLDLCSPESAARYTDLDLIICSDVLEHTSCTPYAALFSLRRMLCPKGLLILSAPTYRLDVSIEWYPGARSLGVKEHGTNVVVEWETLRGVRYVDYSPSFHGGVGNVLEMRIIAHNELLMVARQLGFHIELIEFKPEAGYIWEIRREQAYVQGSLDGRVLALHPLG